MGFRKLGVAAFLSAAVIGFVASPAAAKPLATNDMPSANYAIGSSLAAVESDTPTAQPLWGIDWTVKHPFGAGT